MHQRFPTRRPHWLIALVALLVTGSGVAFIAPADPDADHDHDHAGAPAKEEAHAHDHDHDHGHGHGHGKDGHEGHADEVKLTPEAIRKNRIKVEPVRRQQLRPSFVVPGRVSFNAEALAHVGSAVKGRVTELTARVGDEVKKGDVLVVLESAELGEAQLDFLQKSVAAAASAPLLDAARSALERGRTLHTQNQGIALAELQKRETEFKTAEASARTARTAAVAAKARLRLLGGDDAAIERLSSGEEIDPKFHVRAPLSGTVIEREVTLGELVGPERERLLVVADMTKVWVIADVSEARLKGLAPGASARLTLTSAPGETVEGSVSYVAHTVDPSTRTAKVRIEVDNPRRELRPGMFGSVAIVGRGSEGGQAVLAVPDAAVQTVEGGPAVFVPVEGEENTFAKRAVTVGKPVGGWVPVLTGLKEGEPVVVSGTFILKADLGKSGAAHQH